MTSNVSPKRKLQLVLLGFTISCFIVFLGSLVFALVTVMRSENLNPGVITIAGISVVAGFFGVWARRWTKSYQENIKLKFGKLDFRGSSRPTKASKRHIQTESAKNATRIESYRNGGPFELSPAKSAGLDASSHQDEKPKGELIRSDWQLS